MKDNKKRLSWPQLVAVVLVLAMVLIPVIGAVMAITSVNAQEMVAEEFSLERAKEFARENNYDIALSDLKHESSELGFKMAYEMERDLEKMYHATKSSKEAYQTYQARQGYITQKAEKGEKALLLTNKITELGTDLAIESAYYAVVEKEDIYNIKKKSYKNIEKQVNRSKIKYELGQISELDYLQVELKLDQAKMTLESSMADYKKAVMDFNKQMGLTLSTEIALVDRVEMFEYKLPTYEEMLNKFTGNSVTYVMSKDNVELLTREVNLARAFYGNREPEHKDAINKLEQEKINYNLEVIALEKKTRETVLDYNTLVSGLKVADKARGLYKKVAEVMAVKYETGLATDLEVVEAELDYQNAEVDYISALHKYKLFTEQVEKGL
ncbi:MAG: TolC family protein [Clostridia bacterium]|jgi:outer membrane protein TolC|nr:TolC family protein [Clostridia bacterium]